MRTLEQKANLILRTACNMAERQDKEFGWHRFSNYMRSFRIYANDLIHPDFQTDVVVAGNWNNIEQSNPLPGGKKVICTLPGRLASIFERMGFSIVWSDNVCECVNCNRLLQSAHTDASWSPDFVQTDGGPICYDCWNANELSDPDYECSCEGCLDNSDQTEFDYECSCEECSYEDDGGSYDSNYEDE